LKITPSVSVNKLLGDNYSVELRSGPNAIDLEKLESAIAAKKWLDVLTILKRERVTKYPDESELDGTRHSFLTHEFLALVKTPVDISATHPVSLTEDRPAGPELGNKTISPVYCYVNGKPDLGTGSFPYLVWKRHPDGIGWYFTWRPIDGEIIVVPGLPKDPLVPLSTEDEVPAVNYEIRKVGPVLQSQKDFDSGLVPTLKKKFTLGELTPQQIVDALDKACLERFLAQRKFAVAK
jgi:hypothetical protein